MKSIFEIVEAFNFEKVYSHMVATNWTYRGEATPPDIETLKNTAFYCLQKVDDLNVGSNVGTGGFMAFKLSHGLMLTFNIATTT